MRKALILTRHFPPYVTSGASRAWKFASNLSAIGWEPVVIAPPAIMDMPAGVQSGANTVPAVHRTGPEIEAGGLDAAGRNALLHGGQPLAALNNSLKSMLSGLFKENSGGALWEKSAAVLIDRLLDEEPEIDLLYAQGPPLEPLGLALETARKRPITVVLDITAPLDPAMPPPGSSASSDAAEAEERILLSGVPLLTPTRHLKEYFLQKYRGRLDHGLVTIVPPAFDGSHPAFGRRLADASGTALRIALLVEELPKGELKALVAGLEAWLKGGVPAGGVELLLLGAGASELLRRAAGKPLEKLLTPDDACGLDSELMLCRKAALFCVVQSSAAASASTVPDRLADALGMGLPLCAIAPDGAASRLVLDAGGLHAPARDAGAIAELFRAMVSGWSARTLQGALEELRQKHEITGVMRALTGAIASQPV
ncbi:MAG: hypothetical protein JW764_02265 [Chlorobiaceae bacterium]|nr:hypothetical protein [Chlorobiaceae bacterium]